MNWGNSWNVPPHKVSDENTVPNVHGSAPIPTIWPTVPSSNPLDALNQDELLMKHLALKEQLEKIKNEEMILRKYIVDRVFPNKTEGVNTVALGNGFEAKATVKFNYKLADNKVVENCLDRIALIGNQGAFIAKRLISWHPTFLVTEYRVLQEEAKEGSDVAAQILKIVNDELLTIDDAAPTFVIKEPKKGKK